MTEAPHWGPTPLEGGGTRFAIWAPGVDAMTLRLSEDDRPMEAAGDGWYSLDAADAKPGMDYMFVRPDGMAVPDPAAREQAGDVHGPSRLVDPESYAWQTAEWRGRPFEEAVFYELHIGTFTPEGTFRAAIDKLDHLADLGVTAIEIMPVAQFAGNRGWGYDGVALYAPHNAYGTPDDLKALVDAAHARGLMAFLDVVYNHFGPDGNYLAAYAGAFFDESKHTPWGAAIAYGEAPVRTFVIDNALYWLKEFRFDGLRFDAIDNIRDDSKPEILVEMAERIRAEITDRPVHLTTEDNRNITRLHERGENGAVPLFTAEWNDDFHNVAHVIATGETDAYYADFAHDHWTKFARVLAEGFAYQGEKTVTGGERGKPSAHLPPLAFVDFLQNHDQTGNRAFGERLIDLAEQDMMHILTAILLLSPHVPLLFMGEEWGETRPFTFFTDFHGELAEAVREGRRREFADFAAFDSPSDRAKIPDPNAAATFEAAKIDWEQVGSETGRHWLALYRELLTIRHRQIVPRLAGTGGNCSRVVQADDGVIGIDWQLDGALLEMRANFTGETRECPPTTGRTLFATTIRSDDHIDARSIIVRIDTGEA
ncbi:malto-oligosyltrehalose trehalohydrolase [Pararhizobium mangrovi]|uniref:Malto-oligosyltrehalose trehalohydrolase n=1 Tax=Pararhizobium mangrovi TaxID=2590452 RepID=A0A506U5I9_9HYPH|nr:malto-oligosyltrehalose trehalohydrolase [Pararhizobium mangrovi]TPW29623.1 malto-oligosyltrehalose trehalohydrolase [Pararhizobium mangrovi]